MSLQERFALLRKHGFSHGEETEAEFKRIVTYIILRSRINGAILRCFSESIFPNSVYFNESNLTKELRNCLDHTKVS